MVESILADDRHTTREAIRQAIQQRTTRGMLTYNTGKVHRLEGELWAVPSTRGGFHKVDLGVEVCDCEDYVFFGRERGIGCRHVYAAAIANASRRSGVREVRTVRVAAGDGIAYRAKKSCHCYVGVHYIGELVEDASTGEEVQVVDAVPCSRCAR